MSQAKALAIQDVRPDELVVAADTIVVLEGKVLGKPADADDAAQMLRRLRDRSHWVYSGVSVWHPANRQMVCELGESLVWMRDYRDDEIAEYVNSRDPMDKAGAYAIQNAQFAPVFHVDGCRLNVMGLPLCHVKRALEKFGVVVPANVPGTCRAFVQHDCDISSEILKV
jgi:MAF protein